MFMPFAVAEALWSPTLGVVLAIALIGSVLLIVRMADRGEKDAATPRQPCPQTSDSKGHAPACPFPESGVPVMHGRAEARPSHRNGRPLRRQRGGYRRVAFHGRG